MRDQRIDFIKGMLMWCVVYGHTINSLLYGTSHPPIWLHVFVRTFDMPFFMIISGYFLRRSIEKKGHWNVALNRLSMIAFPIAVWTLAIGRFNMMDRYYFLWAVLASSLICVATNKMVSWMPCVFGKMLEFLVYLCATVFLHLVKIPWNLFYLFPFFIVGYYMSDVSFHLKEKVYNSMVVIFIVGLCFWTTDYTPWRMGACAWKDNLLAIPIYTYRFALGVVGVCVMAKFFEVVGWRLGNGFKIIVGWGRETLALYILQCFFLEGAIGKCCSVIWKHYPVSLSESVMNLVGYVIAPVLSFLFIMALFFVIEKLRHVCILKYAFGFKVK